MSRPIGARAAAAGLAAILAVAGGPPEAAVAADAFPLRAAAPSGALARAPLFDSRPLFGVTADGALIALADRMRRTVTGCDAAGEELWSVTLPAGATVGALAFDAAGRLCVAAAERPALLLYERPASAPVELPLPDSAASFEERELWRSGGDLLLVGRRERHAGGWEGWRIADGGVAETAEALGVAGDATVVAFGESGSIWSYAFGARELRRARGERGRIALEAPLGPQALLAGDAAGIVWALDSSRGLLLGYLPSGFESARHRLEPAPRIPCALVADGQGAFWIADRAGGEVLRYAR